MSRLLFYRVLALHVQLASHLVAIIGKQIIIQRLHVAGYRAADAGSMSGEDSTDLGQFVVDIKGTKTAHPLISVIDDLKRRGITLSNTCIQALHDKPCSIREHRGLVVITIGVERVNTVFLPQPAVNLILLLKIWHEVYQDGDGFSRHCPAPYPHLKAVRLSLPLPIGKERLIFPEIGALLLSVITVLTLP